MGSDGQTVPTGWLISYVCIGTMGKSVTNVCLLFIISGQNGPSRDISVSHWQEPLPGTGLGLPLDGCGAAPMRKQGWHLNWALMDANFHTKGWHAPLHGVQFCPAVSGIYFFSNLDKTAWFGQGGLSVEAENLGPSPCSAVLYTCDLAGHVSFPEP